MRKSLQPHQTALLAAVAVAIVGSLVPPVRFLFIPLIYLNTHLHEMSHAIVAMITGGQVVGINVNCDGSGATPVLGGIMVLVASAGYMGSSLIGAAMIAYGVTPNRARTALGIVGALLAVSMLLWVRHDIVGVISGLFWMVALGLGAALLRGNAALFVCQLIGLEQCFNSISAVYDLLKISVFTEVHSDASIMQSVTLIPAPVWAGFWCLFSLILVGFTVRRSWCRAGPSSPAGSP